MAAGGVIGFAATGFAATVGVGAGTGAGTRGLTGAGTGAWAGAGLGATTGAVTAGAVTPTAAVMRLYMADVVLKLPSGSADWMV